MTLTNNSSSKLYLLVHTMTIRERDLVVQAQFFHTFTDNLGCGSDVRLIGRRMRVQSRGTSARRGARARTKAHLHCPNLKNLMKKKSPPKINHHLRTIRIGTQSLPALRADVTAKIESNPVKCQPQVIVSSPPPPPPPLPPPTPSGLCKKLEDSTSSGQAVDHLLSNSPPEQTRSWLVKNRFEKYAHTFENFSGADMLRMSREDLIQICGQADGIRLFNSLHMKCIAPKLKIYVCRENTSIFNAIFLTTHSNVELLEKLAKLMGVSHEQVRDIYVEGPQSIHVQLSSDVLRHIKEDAMFSVEILQDNGRFVFLLKQKIKSGE